MDYQHITKGGIEVKFMTLAGLLLTLVVGVAARPASKHSSASAIKKATEEVLRIDQERADALVKNDTDQLDRIMADDCTYVHPNGKSETKQEVIAGLKAQDRKYESIERDDVKVRIFGTIAVVTGRNNLKANYQGKEYNVQNRFLRVYAKRQGHWQMIAHQATTIPDKKPDAKTGAAN
jgi:ketosteroid isomerase-like protein